MADETFEDIDLDLDAWEGQRKEADTVPTIVKLRGKRVSFPNPKDWTTDAMDSLEDGDMRAWLEGVLGEDVMNDLTEDGKTPFRMGQIEEIFEAINKKNGQDPKSSGSSSRRSGDPRKRKR